MKFYNIQKILRDEKIQKSNKQKWTCFNTDSFRNDSLAGA
jgi:hypothetical protein